MPLALAMTGAALAGSTVGAIAAALALGLPAGTALNAVAIAAIVVTFLAASLTAWRERVVVRGEDPSED